MAWKLNDPKTEILVGPIVRKVTNQFASVFIITKSDVSARLMVHTEPNDLGIVSKSVALFKPTRIGSNLYANVLYIDTLSCSPKTFCFYNIEFTIGSNLKYLTDPGILTEDGKIEEYCLGSLPLPSFVIPPSNPSELKILHGSCRKLHGEYFDAFIYAEPILNFYASYDNDSIADANRPQILFLTGDQIYGDDVSDITLHIIREINKAYIDFNFETDANILALTTLPNQGTVDYLSPGKRVEIINSNQGAKFTAGDVAGSHLIKMGEYFAMYMLAWSDTFWYDSQGKFSFPSFREVYSDPDITETKTITTRSGITHTYRTTEKERYDENKKNLSGNKFKKVKKILANISTMMIFDDHDVSDDFFITQEWVNNTIGYNASPGLGKRIVSNALTAYAVFQDWGNKPSDYVGATPGAFLLQHLSNSHTSNNIDLNNFNVRVFPRLNYPNSPNLKVLELEDVPGTKIQFHYQYFPHSDALYEIVALNCRTNRLFNDDNAAANLISSNSLIKQIVNNNAPNSTLKISIFLAGTPVFGNKIAEILQHLVPDSFNEEVDGESWDLNKEGREEFLSMLYLRKYASNFSGEMSHKIVILSGDVHHGFAKRISYSGKRVMSTLDQYRLKMRIASFCASSLKNEDHNTKRLNSWDKDSGFFFLGKNNNNGKFVCTTNEDHTYKYKVEQIQKLPIINMDDTEYNESSGDAFVGFNNIGLISFTEIYGDINAVEQELYWPSHVSSIPLTFKLTRYRCDLSEIF